MSAGFHVGDVWKPEATIKNPKTGALVKPSTVLFTVKKPNGTSAEAPATELSEGVYEAVGIKLTEAGPWVVSVTCEGGYEASQPGEIQVAGRYAVSS